MKKLFYLLCIILLFSIEAYSKGFFSSKIITEIKDGSISLTEYNAERNKKRTYIYKKNSINKLYSKNDKNIVAIEFYDNKKELEKKLIMKKDRYELYNYFLGKIYSKAIYKDDKCINTIQHRNNLTIEINCIWEQDKLKLIIAKKNGVVIEKIPYKNNKKHGVVKKFYKSIKSAFGKLKSESYFKDGIIQKYIGYSLDGNIAMETSYKNGVRHGLETLYHEKGNKASTKYFNENIVEGIETSYYKDGKIKSETHWKNNKIHGVKKEYDRNGKVIKEATYVNGIKK